ncbi:UNVERIFIED_CONTAM: hypothetical protein ABIC26_000116 [Paenibacillus sp. PvR008]
MRYTPGPWQNGLNRYYVTRELNNPYRPGEKAYMKPSCCQYYKQVEASGIVILLVQGCPLQNVKNADSKWWRLAKVSRGVGMSVSFWVK